MEAAELINAIHLVAKQADMAPPLRTRLVKLAYLAEIEHYRATGQRLTGLEWIFHQFGPYAHALAPFIGGPDDPDAPATPMAFLNTQAVRDQAIGGIIRRVVKEWGDADLNQLLDYVYFETEPMAGAKRGQLLDFSTIAPASARKQEVLRLDRAKMRELRKRVAESAKRYRERPRPTALTPELADGLQAWDEENTLRIAPGPCRLNPNELV